MKCFRPLVFIASFLLCLVTRPPVGVAGPTSSVADNTFAEEAIREDFRYLYETLRAAHVDLYAHRSRAAYDHRYEEVLGSIHGPMSRLDAVRLFMPFVAFGNIGHARVDFPVQDYGEYAHAGGTLLPLDIRVKDGRIVVAYNYSDEPALAPGTELVSINGRTIADWIERTGRFISAERPYMIHAQLEHMFPRLVWLEAGRIDAFRVTARPLGGNETSVIVDAAPAMAIEEEKGSREGLHNRRTAEVLPDGVAYLRPGPFFAADESETLESFEAFVDDAFRRFTAADARDLVVDLRNNPGGDNAFSDPMIAWFADKPFRFASRFVVKASDPTRAVLRELAGKWPDGVSARMLEAMERYDDGETFPFAIPKVQPRDATFSGTVWALVNRHTYSNATTVAAIIQDYGFGTVLGEETSDLATSYASSAQFALPETGIVVTYPKAYFVRPNGNETLRGVVPDQALEFPVVPGGHDVVLEDALQSVRSQRP